jgi:hypothetical protein
MLITNKINNGMTMKLKTYLLTVLLAATTGTALAGPVMTDLAATDYIKVGNLDWAWAAPIQSIDWYGANTLYQADLHPGWREATDLEWASRPDRSAFGGACAAKYWNSQFTHCDFLDNPAQHRLAAGGQFSDLWYVRSQAIAAQVPEPGSLPLAGIALLMAMGARRKKAG